MSKYAVISLRGNQLLVCEGDEVVVDKLREEKLTPEVLLVADGKKVKIGKPSVKDSKVKIKVIEKEFKGKKLDVMTFKAKSRYRRKVGFRPQYSRLLVEKIS